MTDSLTDVRLKITHHGNALCSHSGHGIAAALIRAIAQSVAMPIAKHAAPRLDAYPRHNFVTVRRKGPAILRAAEKTCFVSVFTFIVWPTVCQCQGAMQHCGQDDCYSHKNPDQRIQRHQVARSKTTCVHSQ